jgi:hypothetical protein
VAPGLAECQKKKLDKGKMASNQQQPILEGFVNSNLLFVF